MTRLLLLLAASIVTPPGSPLAAQNVAERFDAIYPRFLGADSAAERERLAAAASDLFLRLLPGTDLRRARLAAGLHATVAAGRAEVAADIAAALPAAALQDPEVARWQLTAYARAARTGEFAAVLRAARQRGHERAVLQVLADEEARLLPLADRALRRGDAASGRALFEALAGLAPPRAWRYANLGLCLRHLGEIEAAERAYERAVELAPEDAQIRNDLGLLLRATGRGDAARRAFAASYALDTATPGGRPGDGPAITNLLHFAAIAPPGAPPPSPDPLPDAARALGVRPDAAMLRRLLVDVVLDRLGGAAGRDR